MAKLTVMMPEDFEKMIAQLDQNADEIVSAALQEAAMVYKQTMAQELESVIGHNTKVESRSTGELLDSLGVSPAKIDNKGLLNVRAGFNEPRKNQTEDAHTKHKRKGRSSTSRRSYGKITNAMIGATIEYGRTGQAPRPFQKKAKKKAEKDAAEAANRVFDQEASKL